MPLDRVLQPGGLEQRVKELERRLAVMETAASIGAARTKGGTTYWADTAGADQIVLGLQADGSYAIKVGAITITATGPNAGKLLGVVAATMAGLQVNGTINATGDVTGSRVVGNNGVNTGGANNFKFVKTSSTRLDISTT